MPAVRELPLAASLLLIGAALFFGGGATSRSVPWLGVGLLIALLALLATRGVPGGWPAVVPLGLLTLWLALTIAWSALPARSWDYANRALLYTLFAALGLWLYGRTRELALGLMVLLGAVVVWSLLAKVLPPLYDDYGRVARLRGPVGLWNQLALLGDFALALALWRKGRAGTLLAYAWLVALALTYSRGGLGVAVLVVCAWLVLSDERIESGATLVAAALPASVVVAIAFALPGVTSDGQSTATRWRDGLILGVLLLAGAAAAAALARAPRPRDTPALRRALYAAGALALVAAVVGAVLAAGSFTSSSPVESGSGRYTSAGSNFRWEWWQQAWHGFQHARLAGTGAGAFHVTNLQYRSSFLDETTEPHSLPLQFLSETGIVGLVLLVAAVAVLVRPGWRRRGHELALALFLPAYLVHSLIDVDWDFVAVSAPAFVAAGALAGRPAVRRVGPFGLLAAGGAALFAFAVMLLPWLGARWSDDALAASPDRAVRLADRAESVDPLLVDPLWAKAFAAATLNEPRRAFQYYVQAVDREPRNPQTWRLAGEYAFSLRCYRSAYTYLEKYTELDPNGRPSGGAEHYREALRQVNAGNNRC
jgi:tetratricopeptide (TPR) repeat protein